MSPALESKPVDDGAAMKRLYQEVLVAGAIPQDLEQQLHHAILSDRSHAHAIRHSGRIAFMDLSIDPAEVLTHCHALEQALLAAQMEQVLDQQTPPAPLARPRPGRL